METVDTVVVLGSGELGAAWALLCALGRCAVRMYDPSHEALERAATAVREHVDAATGAGALTRGERQRVLDGVLFTTDLDEAAVGADLAVLTAPVDQGVGRTLGGLLRASALVAAPDGPLAAAAAGLLPHPGRVVSLRLLRTPGPLRRAEAAPGPSSTAHALARAARLVERVNRTAGHHPARR